jgi:hypothetical protein
MSYDRELGSPQFLICITYIYVTVLLMGMNMYTIIQERMYMVYNLKKLAIILTAYKPWPSSSTSNAQQ